MQSHTSPCPKAPWGGKYTLLEQYTTIENVLDKYIQKRINEQLDRGLDTVVKGKCHKDTLDRDIKEQLEYDLEQEYEIGP